MGRFVLGRVRFEPRERVCEANLPFLRHLVMSSIVVCNRTTRRKSDRIKLNLVNLKGSVICLKNEVAKAVGLQPRDLELIYCGQCLGDDRLLEASGVKSGSTVFALRKHGPPKEATPGSFYLDQMSDDEDDDRQGPPAGVTGGRQEITSSQLMAALAAATSEDTSMPESTGPPAISMDFFQQAIQQAQNAATEAQLQQLHAMGITDDNVAREALQPQAETYRFPPSNSYLETNNCKFQLCATND
ncbi:hypothetical protein ScPMuIL_002115 [Solemya velum]